MMFRRVRVRIALVVALAAMAILLSGCCCYCCSGPRRSRPFRSYRERPPVTSDLRQPALAIAWVNGPAQ